MTCEYCSTSFALVRSTQRFCSVDCRIRAKTRRLRATNPEVYKANFKRWWSKNKKSDNERTRKWKSEHKDYISDYNLQYKKEHWETIKAQLKGRRVVRRAKLAINSTLTAREWAALQSAWGQRCAYCKTKSPLSQDHVVPVSKGGDHTLENVVPACLECNIQKSDHDVADFLVSDYLKRRILCLNQH